MSYSGDIVYESPKKILWNTIGHILWQPYEGFVQHYETQIMTALWSFCETLWNIAYDSPKKDLWNTISVIQNLLRAVITYVP
jgi:hypothetical protein